MHHNGGTDRRDSAGTSRAESAQSRKLTGLCWGSPLRRTDWRFRRDSMIPGRRPTTAKSGDANCLRASAGLRSTSGIRTLISPGRCAAKLELAVTLDNCSFSTERLACWASSACCLTFSSPTVMLNPAHGFYGAILSCTRSKVLTPTPIDPRWGRFTSMISARTVAMRNASSSGAAALPRGAEGPGEKAHRNRRHAQQQQ